MRTYIERMIRIERRGVRGERGYTLLEYVAGAAIIGGIVFTALTGFGTSMAGFLNGLGTWAQTRTGELQ